MTRKNHDQNAVRRYLLEPLAGPEKESIESRLLEDEEFLEELEIVEDELVDEYLANELSPAEHKNFETYFLAHPARREKLEGSKVLKRYLDSVPSPYPKPISPFEYLRRWVQQYFFPPRFAVGVAVPVVLVIAGVGLWLLLIRQSELKTGLDALNNAYRSERPIEARVSSFDHAPFIARRGNESANVNTLELDRANLYLSNEYRDRPNADSAHALGKLYLFQKNPDKAIQFLDQARTNDPENAQVYADLGAAYFEKGRQGPDNSAPNADLARSLEHLNKALELKPDLLEALFNRALVYQYQGMNHLAEADWRTYLQKDPSSDWAIEAQRKLKELEDKKATSQNPSNPLDSFIQAYQSRDESTVWEIYKSNYTSSGSSIVKELLNDFLSDKPKLSGHIDTLNYVGQLELRQRQDAFTGDLFKVYRSASPEKLTLLAQARRQLKDGYKLFGESQLNEAQKAFVTARDAFTKLNDLPEALIAEAAAAHAATLEPDLVRAQELFTRIIPQCDEHNYKWLFAQTLSRRAHLESNLTNYSKAISDANQALELFQKLEDPNGTLGGFIQLASFHFSLNDIELSFSYLRRARAVAEKMRAPPGDIWGIHIATSLNLTALKLYRAALDYQNEALRIAFDTDLPIYLSRTYQNIGLTYGHLQQFEPALQNLRLAYDQGKRIEQERLGKNMMANASLKLGDFYRASGDPGNALTAYEESSKLYESIEFFHYSYAAHKGRFLSYLSLHDDAMASQELEIVVNLFDDYRQRIQVERQKVSFFDREQDIYDLAIDFTYSRLGNHRRAFEYSEISRARNLRELMVRGVQVTQSDSGPDLRPAANSHAPPADLTAAEIEQQMPEQVQIVQLAVLEKKLLIWHVSRSGIFPAAVEIESTKLNEAVATTLNQIRKRDDASVTASLKQLYRLIIEPIKHKLDPNKVLCIVADKALHYLPWNALISESSGRSLFQDFRLMTSPSATILIESTNRARARTAPKDERLLAVGNPTFDRAANPNLSNLPGAEREVRGIGSHYSSPRLLIGARATRPAVLSEVAQADVIHFAAHYEVDPRSTLLSKLLLAQSRAERSHAEQSGLTAADIYGLSLARTRLVVLSGCETAIERDFGGEGPIGFARSFLVARVPVVVASLWSVDSDATSLLMIEFHRFRREKGISTTEALMRAQQEIMMRPGYESPYYWAGFVVVGGYADY